MSKIILIITFSLVGIIIYLYYPSKLKSRTIRIKGQDFYIEVATTPSQLSKGLGGRSDLCNNCGMLFVFQRPQILSFWMKDTLIPLDMIFIDRNKKIINIVTATVGDLSIKNSISPALYCLELNSGTTAKLNLKPGDVLEL